ncbi:MAG: CRISPR-associated endonuclease Cas1 [Rhodanobacteraceae bacterium]
MLKVKNSDASHPVNAMLNYTYGMLEDRIRVAVTSAGLDATIGYLHTCRPGRDALVYDLMEPWRPVVDAKVLGFVQKHTFAPSDFTLRRDGVCRLNPQLARALIAATQVVVRPAGVLELIV